MNFRVQIIASLLIIPFSFHTARTVAQSSAADSLVFKKALGNAVASYYQATGDQSRLYNGTQYAGYPFAFTEGTPFFLSDKQQKGSIEYDKVFYKDVSLLYDELSAVLIMQDANHRIQLLNDKISRFTILDYPFIRIVNDSNNSAVPATGFYNVLYEG